MTAVPEIDATDPQVLSDPFGAYGRAREVAPLARLLVPGMRPMWVVTRYEGVRAMLADPRFEVTSDSFMRPPVAPELAPYLVTMSEKDGPEHARLRRLAAPAFTARRAADLRPRVEAIVDRLLSDLPDDVDLLADFARPLPMEVICELVGIPEPDRPQWRDHGTAIAAGHGERFATAIPAIIDGAKAAIAHRRATSLAPVEPAGRVDQVADRRATPLASAAPVDQAGPGKPACPHTTGAARATDAADVLAVLIQGHDDDRLDDTELVTLVWHLVLAGQTPTNLIANAMAALFDHPEQLAWLRADPSRVPGAVEELTRWCSPQLLATPRYTREDVDFFGHTIPKGEPVIAALAAANHDPRVFPEGLDVTRPPGQHLAYSHGPHYCLGASLARVETEVAIAALLSRYPEMAIAGDIHRAPDAGTWRLAALPVRLRT